MSGTGGFFWIHERPGALWKNAFPGEFGEACNCFAAIRAEGRRGGLAKAWVGCSVEHVFS
jgi:hypothetical protein